MDDVVVEFLKNGVLGAAVIGLAIAVWRIYRALQKVNESRVGEAREVTQQLLDLSQTWTEMIAAQTAMIEHHNENVTALRNECRERTEAVRVMIRELILDLKNEMKNRNSRGG